MQYSIAYYKINLTHTTHIYSNFLSFHLNHDTEINYIDVHLRMNCDEINIVYKLFK